MADVVVCVAEAEPDGFHDATWLAFSVRLSFESGEEHAEGAVAAFDAFLQQVGVRDRPTFGLYRYVQPQPAEDGAAAQTAKLAQIALTADQIQIVRADYDAALADEFSTWLRGYWSPAGFRGASSNVGDHDETSIAAEQVVLGMASQLAPLPQVLRLACVVRVAQAALGGSIENLVIVPHVFDEDALALEFPFPQPGAVFAPDPTEPANAPPSAAIELAYGGGSPRRFRTSIVAPLTAQSTLVDAESGFCAASNTAADVAAALQRFEQRSPTQLTGYFAASEMRWMPDDAGPGTEEELTIARMRHVRFLAWRAVTSLSSALDTLLLAIAMPGREERDGALLAPLLDFLQRAIEATGAGPNARRLHTRAALRKALRDQLLERLKLTPQTATDASDGRKRFVKSLKAWCGIGSTPSFLTALLCAYVDCQHAQTWETFFENEPLEWLDADTRTRELDRLLADLNGVLTSEAGVEATVLRMLENDEFKEPVVTTIATVLAPGVNLAETAARVYADAVDRFKSSMQADFNAADACRQAAGSLFADLLVRDVAAVERSLTIGALKEVAAEKWSFWWRRFDLPDPDATPVPVAASQRDLPETVLTLNKVLAHPMTTMNGYFGAKCPLPDDSQVRTDHEHAGDNTALAAIAHAACAMQTAVLADLFPSPDARVVPDSAPRPLAVQIMVDPAADDADGADDFSAAFSGISLLMRRRIGAADASSLAYANLAEVTVIAPPGLAAPAAHALTPLTLQPIPTTVIDGRRQLFVSYHGLPFASSAFDDALPADTDSAANERKRFYATDYPNSRKYAKVPTLAYGARYDVIAHVIGRSGALPLTLQQDPSTPWVPVETIPAQLLDPPAQEAASIVTTIDYMRTTAIGRTGIGDAAGTRRIGVVPPGVRPLIADYPRVAFAAGRPFDLLRGNDGNGLIALPESGTTTLVLRDVYRWSTGPASLSFDALCAPNATWDASGSGAIAVDLKDAVTRTITIAITRVMEKNDQGPKDAVELAISTEAGPTVYGQLECKDAVGMWLRLRLTSADTASAVSFADPSAEVRGTGTRTAPANLVLIAPQAKSLWRAPLADPVTLLITFPRVSYTDFERWTNNETLRQAVYDTADEKLCELFRTLLLAAHIARTDDVALAKALERLPDPAVHSIELEVVPLDGLRDEPSKLAASFKPMRWTLSVPTLGSVLRTLFPKVEDLNSACDSHGFAYVLEKIDASYTRTLELAGEDGAGMTHSDSKIRVPAGINLEISARPRVPKEHFEVGGNLVATIREELKQWALGEQDRTYLFEGATVRVESMTSALVERTDATKPWAMDPSAWRELAAKLVSHEPSGRARRYALVAEPTQDDWTWRQLGWIDVQTQRWRHTGRPIYSWIAPRRYRKALRPGTDSNADLSFAHSFELIPATDAQRSVAFQAIAAFESEAFANRPDADADNATADLAPLAARTNLLTVDWEKPTATWFRHRLTLRSRYAGAFLQQRDGECAAWSSDDTASAWRRVAFLADRRRIELLRPQVRALIPLTHSPDAGADRTPPIAAVLQERPFDQGGLAERIVAEARTGVGYVFVGDKVEPGDLRKELGPDPRLSFFPAPGGKAQRALLSAEGPLGLTFDATAGTSQAFPNSVLMLHPETLAAAGNGYVAQPLSTFAGDDAPLAVAGAQEHFFGVALRRYLDPEWLVDEGEPSDSRFDRAVRVTFADGTGAMKLSRQNPITGLVTELTAARCRRVDRAIAIDVNRCVIDDTVIPNFGDPVDTDFVTLCLLDEYFDEKGIAAGRGDLAFMHVPLDEKRASLSVYLLPRQGALRGSGSAPALLGSVDWTMPRTPEAATKVGEGSPVRISLYFEDASGTAVRPVPTAVSGTTALNWARTNRNFEAVFTSSGADEAAHIRSADLIARIDAEDEHIKLSFERSALAAHGVPAGKLYVRSWQADNRFPGHAQRHVAALFSRTYRGLGRTAEQLASAHLLCGRTTAIYDVRATENVDHVRLAEFEVPAAIVGYAEQWATIPEALRHAYFDLVAIGFERCKEATLGAHQKNLTFTFSFHARLIGSSASLEKLHELELGVRTDDPAKSVSSIKFARPGTFTEPLRALEFDLELNSGGVPVVQRAVLIGASGARIDAVMPAKRSFDDLDKDDLGVKGLVFSIQHATGATELWLEIGLLASARDGNAARGFSAPLDFDWFFGNEEADFTSALKEERLRQLHEAQARLVSVSPPIPIVRER